MKTLAVVILLAASVTGQVEHAPTVAQCQADQRLWWSQVENNAGDQNGDTLSASYHTVRVWQQEMVDCAEVDPQNRTKYYNLDSEMIVVLKRRLEHFIERHDLSSKFIEEDAAGKR